MSPTADTCFLILWFQSTFLIALHLPERLPIRGVSGSLLLALPSLFLLCFWREASGWRLASVVKPGCNESLFFWEAPWHQLPFSCDPVRELVSFFSNYTWGLATLYYNDKGHLSFSFTEWDWPSFCLWKKYNLKKNKTIAINYHSLTWNY